MWKSERETDIFRGFKSSSIRIIGLLGSIGFMESWNITDVRIIEAIRTDGKDPHLPRSYCLRLYCCPLNHLLPPRTIKDIMDIKV